LSEGLALSDLVTVVLRSGVRVLLVLALVALLVGHSRRDGPALRVPRPARAVAAGSFRVGCDTVPKFFDRDTGKGLPMAIPAGVCLGQASVSPWTDVQGVAQVLAYATRWSGQGRQRLLRESGLIRFRDRGAEVLDWLPFDVILASPPCWYPGREARVLLAGEDGDLYCGTFDRPADAAGRAGRGPTIQKLVWRIDSLNGADLSVADPSWPADPRLWGRVYAAVRSRCGAPDGRLPPFRIGWFRLDAEGLTVVDCGWLFDPVGAGIATADERFPVLAHSPAGPIVAYLRRIESAHTWQLRVAPVVIDSATGVPWARADSADVLVDGCQRGPIAFSSDGRWVTCVLQHRRRGEAIGRFPISGLFRRNAAPGAPCARSPLIRDSRDRPAAAR
jgi:hypothetical protein